MTSKTDRFPYGTKSSFTKDADYEAVCEMCGWKATTCNGILLAVQHHGQTGHRVTCEVFYTVVWKAAVGLTAVSTGSGEIGGATAPGRRSARSPFWPKILPCGL